jgi:hypothetical protein
MNIKLLNETKNHLNTIKSDLIKSAPEKRLSLLPENEQDLHARCSIAAGYIDDILKSKRPAVNISLEIL